MGITAGLVTVRAAGCPSEEGAWVFNGLDPLICCGFTDVVEPDASVITWGLLEATLRVTCIKKFKEKKLINKLKLLGQNLLLTRKILSHQLGEKNFREVHTDLPQPRCTYIANLVLFHGPMNSTDS